MPRYKNPAVAVNVIVEDRGRILLVKRNKHPFKGRWSLPGGYVEYGETVEQAAQRELLEECGIKVRLDQIVGVYSDPERQLKKHVIAICYKARALATNAKKIHPEGISLYFPKNAIPAKLAFDHQKMLNDHVRRIS